MRTMATLLLFSLTLWARTASADPTLPAGQHQAHLTGAATFGSEMGVAEGAPPSRAHPRGTVLVAWSLQQRGPTLTEWDLAQQRVVRQVSLGWDEANVRVVRAGKVLHILVAHGDGFVGYARVDAETLRISCRAELGRGTNLDIAADDTTAAAAWVDLSMTRVHDRSRLQLAMLDATCEATRSAASVEVGWAGGSITSRSRCWAVARSSRSATVRRGASCPSREAARWRASCRSLRAIATCPCSRPRATSSWELPERSSR